VRQKGALKGILIKTNPQKKKMISVAARVHNVEGSGGILNTLGCDDCLRKKSNQRACIPWDRGPSPEKRGKGLIVRRRAGPRYANFLRKKKAIQKKSAEKKSIRSVETETSGKAETRRSRTVKGAAWEGKQRRSVFDQRLVEVPRKTREKKSNKASKCEGPTDGHR